MARILSQTEVAINGRAWRKANLEKARAASAKWKARNPERVAEKTTEGHERNKLNGMRKIWRAAIYARKSAAFRELKNHPCIDCGGKFPSECMDFDHVRGDKVSTVGLLVEDMTGKREAEIAKCDLVCANCHRIRTNLRRRKSQ